MCCRHLTTNRQTLYLDNCVLRLGTCGIQFTDSLTLIINGMKEDLYFLHLVVVRLNGGRNAVIATRSSIQFAN